MILQISIDSLLERFSAQDVVEVRSVVPEVELIGGLIDENGLHATFGEGLCGGEVGDVLHGDGLLLGRVFVVDSKVLETPTPDGIQSVWLSIHIDNG